MMMIDDVDDEDDDDDDDVRLSSFQEVSSLVFEARAIPST